MTVVDWLLESDPSVIEQSIEHADRGVERRTRPLEARYPGKLPVETDDGEGRPSRWNTLRALRVLRWNERARS